MACTLASIRNLLNSLEGYTADQTKAATKIRNTATIYQNNHTESTRAELVAVATAQGDFIWGVSGAVANSIDIIKQLVDDLEEQK
ncbi:hypothetical protein FC18_GL000204 [Lacticaseibacillus sharpeae JCM 1186 = DSM 20505]|uniref:Uncharacterized protein n=2 Tax=Lacticaseibacillus sharpeae TaxID=1626 RepID=A0A0R1ZPB9_9LACO|nr:hypothetical protein FC18_GL000204 [Lacticaseibacillus sharpeae JCM 1186 = DSM 20505]